MEPFRQAVTSVVGDGVVVFTAPIERLQQTHGNLRKADSNGSGHKWRNEKDKEQDQHCKIENSKANHPPLAKLGLLEGVDRRADLSTSSKLVSGRQLYYSRYLPRSQPEEDDRMELVNIRNTECW